jgi:hypothetical protein
MTRFYADPKRVINNKATRNGIIIDGIEYKLVEGIIYSCTKCPLLEWCDRHPTSCKPCELWGSGYHFELGEQERYIDTNKKKENK